MPLAIRAMTPQDWPQAAAIYQKGIDTGLATLEASVPPYEAWDLGHVQTPRLVAEREGRVAGWAALSRVSLRSVYAGVMEVSIYVDPDLGGQGVGTALLTALCAAARAEGIWTLQSSILRENEPSLRLHARCGFRIVGVRERLGRDPQGNWRDVVLLEYRDAKR